MAEQQEATASSPPEGENAMFSALLTELRTINANITTMHNDINNLVVEDGQFDLEEGNVPDNSNGGEGEADAGEERDERASVTSEVSVDAKLAQLLTSTKKAQEQTASTSRTNLLSSIAQDLTVSEKAGTAVQKDLANIVISLFKEKLPDDKVQAKIEKYPRPENIENLKTPRVNPLIWNNISASARSVDVKYQKTQQTLLAAISAMVYAADHAVLNHCDKTLITALTDGIAMATQCQHELSHTRKLAMKKELNPDLAALCNTAKSGEFLFGDLSQLSKEITETNKLTKKVRSSHSTSSNRPKATHRPPYNNDNRRFQPYQRPRRGHFLERGRSQGMKRKKDAPMNK